jgi:hypothetical protein
MHLLYDASLRQMVRDRKDSTSTIQYCLCSVQCANLLETLVPPTACMCCAIYDALGPFLWHFCTFGADYVSCLVYSMFQAWDVFEFFCCCSNQATIRLWTRFRKKKFVFAAPRWLSTGGNCFLIRAGWEKTAGTGPILAPFDGFCLSFRSFRLLGWTFFYW